MAGGASAFDTPWFNSQDQSFFDSLNKTKTPHLVLTAETEDFNEELTQQWRDEGFDVQYVPLLQGGDEYIKRVHATGDSFGASERYAIVAYGDAASVILEAHRKPNNPRLCAIIAYYPSAIPSVHTRFPLSVKILVHLAGNEIGVRQTSQVLGIQGKRKVVRKSINPGKGHGESLQLGFQAYTYSGAEPGFSESDLDEYDPIAAGIAFSRSLATLHKGFRLEPGLEAVCDTYMAARNAGDSDKLEERIWPKAHTLYVPSLSGSNDIARFYAKFSRSLPEDYTSTLLSRTVGTDRVVDELRLIFKHSKPMSWLLPGIPATNREVDIVIVSILHVRGGKILHERVYWDQASVLAQVGLLDPKLAVPETWRKKGVESLPVFKDNEAEAAEDSVCGDVENLNDVFSRTKLG